MYLVARRSCGFRFAALFPVFTCFATFWLAPLLSAQQPSKDYIYLGSRVIAVESGAAVSITTTSPLPAGVVGVAYSAALAATGGVAPYSWSVVSGALPSGLTLAAGTISGTPVGTGTAVFTVTVSDANGSTATKALSITVGSVFAITTTTLPSGIVGVSYTTALGASGGTTPYHWALASGTLPPGLNLSAAGVISGTPTTPSPNPYTFTVSAVDASSPVQTAAAALSVLVFPVSISLSSTMASVSAVAGQGTITVTSNVPWTVVSDAAWLTVVPASGAPPSAGVSYSYSQNASGASRVGHLNFTTGSANTQFTLTQDRTHTYTVSPAQLNLYYAEVEQFLISVDGGTAAINSGVTWSISSVSDGGTGGTITTSGYYTAPNRANGTHPVITITAQPTDGSGPATATVNISYYQPPPNLILVPSSGGGSGMGFTFNILAPNGGTVTDVPQWTEFLFNTGGTGNTANQCYFHYTYAGTMGISSGPGAWSYSPGPFNTPNAPWAISNAQCAISSAGAYSSYYRYATNPDTYQETSILPVTFGAGDSGQYAIYAKTGWVGTTPQWIQGGYYTPSSASAPSAAFDAPGTITGTAAVTGWAIDNIYSTVGSVAEIDVYLDGVLLASTNTANTTIIVSPISRVARSGSQYNPCTLYPGRADCQNPGFTFNWNTSAIHGTSQHTLLLMAVGTGQQWTYVATTVTVQN